MRRLSTFEDGKAAKILGAYLYTQGITNEVRPAEAGEWSIWVHAEEQMDHAAVILEEYQTDPDNPRYHGAWEKAQTLLKKEQQAQQEALKKHIDVRSQFRRRRGVGLGRVTLILIAFSVLVAFMTRLGNDHSVVRLFTIVSFTESGGYISWNMMRDLYSGELWRLITPIFLHFGWMHIIFNLWWLKDLGSAIEHRQSSMFLLFFIMVVGVVSNVAQFLIERYPLFGGMSGVVYGLLGYLWIRGKYDPSYGIRLNPQVVVFMIGWFFLCFTGLVGKVANVVHATGLGIGIVWGYFSSKHWLRWFRS